jgi:SAM-dependent methyltransferase
MPDSNSFRFQDSNITEFLRYREFYQTILADIDIGAAPRVLVFGCSTGDEVQTIYHFWPRAAVWACDIQEDMLAETRRRFPNAHVFSSTPRELEDCGPFDFICANSVFCRNPLPDGPMAEILPFARVDEYLTLLTGRLADSGILMVYNSNYFVQDMSCYKQLVGINISRSWTGAFIPRLTTAGHVCATPVITDGKIASYIIDPDRAPRDLAHLSCALFRKESRSGDIVVNVNAGAKLSAYKPVRSSSLQFPQVADFSTIFMPYFHTTSCSVGDARYSIAETYVTDFVQGGWTLHGLTFGVDRAR